MPQNLTEIATPAVLIDADALEQNILRMQEVCRKAGVELWPHIKTHKLVPVLRRQLEAGAIGATCAKIGEAEALLPSGVRRVFIAHSMGDASKAPRLKALSEKLDQLVLAVTSEAEFVALSHILDLADISVDVLLAVDTGLKREGVRSAEAGAALAGKIRSTKRMNLIGLYTHEGQSYSSKSAEDVAGYVSQAHKILCEVRSAVGGDLPLWPGCSVTAMVMAGQPHVRAVRPGAYVFGDLYLSEVTKVTSFDAVALSVLATVLDRPEPGMAFIDAGSKVFSSDKIDGRLTARCLETPAIEVVRLSEEHGFLAGEGVDQLELGQRLRFQPAHVCPVINLASQVHLVRDGQVLETWTVDGRGRSD